MIQQLDLHEKQIINQILSLAEFKYNQELISNPDATFNLIKLLSAYNDILPHYGLSSINESRIYNCLVSASKKYNPASRQQWNAVISRAQIITPQRYEDRISERRKTFNTPVSQFINESMNNSKITAYSQRRKKRSISNNRLLIRHQDSQNQIRQCSSNQIFPKDNSKLQTTIQGLTMSRDNLKILLSFPTCHTQQTLVDEQQIIIENRADMFYKINTYTKVFLVFKVSILVREEMEIRQQKLQRKIQKIQLKNSLIEFRDVVYKLKAKRSDIQKMSIFYQSNLKKKSIKCLKVLKELSIRKSQKPKQLLLSKNLNLEFIKQLLKSGVDSENKLIFERLWQQKRHQDLQKMFRTFGKNIIPTSSFFQNLQFEMYKNTKRIVFSAFRTNLNRHQLMRKSLLDIQKLEAIQKLIMNTTKSKQIKTKQLNCSIFYRKSSLGSCLWHWKKHLLQDKKYKLIQTKIKSIYGYQLKRTIMTIFEKQRQKYMQTKIINKQLVKKRKQEHRKDIIRKCFNILRSNLELQKNKKNLLQRGIQFRKNRLLTISFQGFLKNTLYSKQQDCLSNLVKQMQRSELHRVVKKWKKVTAFKKLSSVIKSTQLRNTFWYICETILQQKVQNRNIVQAQKFYKKMIFMRLGKRATEQRNQRAENQQKLKQNLRVLSLCRYLKKIKYFIQSNKQQSRKQIQNQNKTVLVINKLRGEYSKCFVSKIKGINQNYKKQISCFQILQIKSKKKAFLLYQQFFKKSGKIRIKQQKMLRTVFKIHFMRLNILLTQKRKLTHQLLKIKRFQQHKIKNTLSKCFEIFKKIAQVAKCIQSKSVLHFQLNIIQKVFLSFKSNMIQQRGVEQINNRNTKKLVSIRKNYLFKEFRCLTRRKKQQKNTIYMLNGYLVFNKLRQFYQRLRFQQQNKGQIEEQYEKTIFLIKKIYIKRFKRMDNLKKINYKPMMKSLGFSRFVANVNKQFMRRKMNEIATFHYMHSILSRSMKNFKHQFEKQRDIQSLEQ